LQATTIRANDGHRRRCHSRGRFFPLRQRQGLVSGDGLIPFATTLQADVLDEPLDLFGTDVQFGQLDQIVTGRLKRAIGDAGINDLVLKGRAVVGAIKAQAFGLREKKPADSGDSSLQALATELPQLGFARGVVRLRCR
jgi:hypothetical protein